MNTKMIKDRKKLIKSLNNKMEIMRKEMKSIEGEIINELKEDFIVNMLPKFKVGLEYLSVKNYKDDCHPLFGEYMYHYTIELVKGVEIHGSDGNIDFIGERIDVIKFLQEHNVEIDTGYIKQRIKENQKDIDDLQKILDELK